MPGRGRHRASEMTYVSWVPGAPHSLRGARKKRRNPAYFQNLALSLSAGDTEIVGHSHQIDQGFRLHLSRDPAAVDLHRLYAQPQQGRNLLGRATADDMRQDFAFARCQQLKAL